MPKIKRPVMYNTTHKYNLTLVDTKMFNLRVKVTTKNFNKLLKEFKKPANTLTSKLEHSSEVYEINASDGLDVVALLTEMCPKVAHVYYYTKEAVPDAILDLFNTYTNGTVVYLWSPQGNVDAIVEDASKAFQSTEVNVKLDIVLPEVNVWHLLFELYRVHAKVDQLILSFPSFPEDTELDEATQKHYDLYEDTGLLQVHSKDKFRCFKVLQHAVSVWGMGVQIEVRNDAEKALLDYYRDCDQGRILRERHKVTLKEVLDLRLEV